LICRLLNGANINDDRLNYERIGNMKLDGNGMN